MNTNREHRRRGGADKCRQKHGVRLAKVREAERALAAYADRLKRLAAWGVTWSWAAPDEVVTRGRVMLRWRCRDKHAVTLYYDGDGPARIEDLAANKRTRTIQHVEAADAHTLVGRLLASHGVAGGLFNLSAELSAGASRAEDMLAAFRALVSKLPPPAKIECVEVNGVVPGVTATWRPGTRQTVRLDIYGRAREAQVDVADNGGPMQRFVFTDQAVATSTGETPVPNEHGCYVPAALEVLRTRLSQ